MADYRLPMDADGVKYHGTVDQNEENPGQFMYGLDENGNKRIIRTDEQGNVLTRLTGSNVEVLEYRNITVPSNSRFTVDRIDVSNYSHYTVAVVSNVQHDYEVLKRNQFGGHALDHTYRTILEADYNRVSDKQDIVSPDVYIYVLNKKSD